MSADLAPAEKALGETSASLAPLDSSDPGLLVLWVLLPLGTDGSEAVPLWMDR